MENNALNELAGVCPDPVIGINRRGVINLFNRAAARLIGYAVEDVIGKLNIVRLYSSPEIGRDIKKALYSDDHGGVGQLEGYETSVKTSDGRRIPIRLSATVLMDQGKEVGSIGFFHDLTSRNEMEDTLKRLSITDSLTGLNNQGYFHSVLEEEVSRIKRYGRDLSLICMDLDNFKQINDELGHLEGDKVIRFVADILKSILRSSDFAFRYGGDEFMVLLAESSAGEAARLAERIRIEFNQRWKHDYTVQAAACPNLSISFGIAEWKIGDDAESFIRRADHSMYDSKRQGGNRVTAAVDGKS